MKRYFFTKAVGYERGNVLNMFSNTIVAIYKDVTISCFFKWHHVRYFFFYFFILQISEHTKKTFYYCNLNLVGPYCMCTEQRKMHQYFNLSRFWFKQFQYFNLSRLMHCLAVNGGHFEHFLDWNQHVLQHSTTNFGFNVFSWFKFHVL